MPKIVLELEVRGHAFVPGLLESNSVVIGETYPFGSASVTLPGSFGHRAWGAPNLPVPD